MCSHRREFRVVQACTTHARIIEFEAQWADEVKGGPGIGAEPNDVPSVTRDFGSIEHDVKGWHEDIIVVRDDVNPSESV